MSSKKKVSTRSLTVTGMMVAITLLLAYTPLGIIPLQPVSATITHIPTIIIALLEGPIMGAVVGAAFGIASLIKAVTQPSGILDPYFINPLVSVLPRICIGLVTGYAYKGMIKLWKQETVTTVIAAALGSLTNTLGSMGMLYVLYVQDMTEKIGEAAGPVIWGIITTYGIVEMLAAAVISTSVVLAVRKAIYRSRTA